MFDLDSWLEIYASLRKNRLRTLLTAFGVFWGIFMLVIMLGSGNGLQNGVTAGFMDSATNSFFVWTMRTSKPYAGLPPGRSLQMNNADTAALVEQLAEAETVAPRNQLGGFMGGNNVTRGTKAGGFTVMGDMPAIQRIQSARVAHGRFLNRLDLEEKRKVAVIGPRVREVLFTPDEDPVGQDIRINGVYFKVVGISQPSSSGDQAEREMQTVQVPFSTFQTAFNYGDRVGWYAITVRPGTAASVVEEKALQILRARHRVAPDDSRAFGHFNLEEEFRKVQGLFAGIGLLVWIVGTGTLAAGVIGVSNIMLIIVRERTKEIGLKRAIGATPWSITSQIVLESIVLTALAGYVGLVAGVAVVEAVSVVVARAGSSMQMFQNPGVSVSNALLALAILTVSGALAGLVPAQRALAISPVQALHSE